MLEALKYLITRASSSLSQDMISALEQSLIKELPGSPAYHALEVMIENLKMSRDHVKPLCQDTGQLIFFVTKPVDITMRHIQKQIEEAVRLSTKEGILRQNCVDPLTETNNSFNIGLGMPQIYWSEWSRPDIQMWLILKGGGCENVSGQWSLPDASLNASRDFEGVKKVVLRAVHQAQGQGCGPGVLSVVIGGDRGSAYSWAKKQFLRSLGVRHPHPRLASLEEEILKLGNELGIGPMGFGGRTTLLDVFCDAIHRLPASYFVTVSYMCWAYRRRGILITSDHFYELEKPIQEEGERDDVS